MNRLEHIRSPRQSAELAPLRKPVPPLQPSPYGAGNSYSGITTITTGILSVSADGLTAGSTGSFGAVPSVATPGDLVISGGTLLATATFAINPNRGITLGGTIAVAATKTLTYNGIAGAQVI